MVFGSGAPCGDRAGIRHLTLHEIKPRQPDALHDILVSVANFHKEKKMYKKILVPTDGSDTAAKAIGPAVELARLCQASIVGVSVSDPYPYTGLADSVPVTADAYRASTSRAAEEALLPLQEACRAAGVACECLVSEDMHPWKALLDAAVEKTCDLVVMASHGRRGVQAVLLGSETQKLLTHSNLPVLVGGGGPPPPGGC